MHGGNTEFPNNLSVPQVLERAAVLAPDKTAVVDRDRRKTYRELNQMATHHNLSSLRAGLIAGQVAPDPPLHIIFRGIFPFPGGLILLALLLTAFPQTALYPPSLISY